MAHIKDIIGYPKEVKKLESVCDFLKNTDRYGKFGVELPDSMLICGESGVGKTLMAGALADDCGREVFCVSGRSLTVKIVKKLFKAAKKSANAVVVVDDIDYKHKVDDADVFAQVLDELRKCQDGEVFAIVTADDKTHLPDFFSESFDADMVIQLTPPTIEEAREIFRPIFDKKRVDKKFDVNDFCCFAQDWTYSEVDNAFNAAARLAVFERCKRVCMPHLIKSCMTLKGYELAEQFDAAAAYHEAGHAAANLLLGGDAACIVLYGKSGGFFKEKNWDVKSYKDHERRYVVSVAGKAAEEIFMGIDSLGSSTDLSRVAQAIEADVRAFASQGFRYFDSTVLNSPDYNDALTRKIQSDIQRYYDAAKELITANRALVEALVEKLKDKFYLLHSEIYDIYNRYVASKNQVAQKAE